MRDTTVTPIWHYYANQKNVLTSMALKIRILREDCLFHGEGVEEARRTQPYNTTLPSGTLRFVQSEESTKIKSLFFKLHYYDGLEK